ncbi:MAG: hypothetical protein LBG29_08170 [Synergistaceae bacterium]|jgi:hypothetical protein|nr:hypothetical protein [Synergistaceae bacterium]
MIETCRQNGIKMLVVIVDRRQEGKISEILAAERVQFHFIALAEGTAGSEIMALLGLESIDKSFVCCLEPAYRIPGLLESVSAKLQLRKPGNGIAFTMPISCINNSVLTLLTKQAENDEITESGGDKLENANSGQKHELIVSIVGHGFAALAMASAKDAGATGGTVLHGRKLGVDEDAKFLGITPQLEKDIVAILSPHEKRNDIMRAITKSCGGNTEAHGIILSLPVEEIEGLGERWEK